MKDHLSRTLWWWWWWWWYAYIYIYRPIYKILYLDSIITDNRALWIEIWQTEIHWDLSAFHKVSPVEELLWGGWNSHPLFPVWYNFESVLLRWSSASFSNPYIASPTSQLIVQPFRRFTYVTAHSRALPLLHLRQRHFTYVTWRATNVPMMMFNISMMIFVICNDCGPQVDMKDVNWPSNWLLDHFQAIWVLQCEVKQMLCWRMRQYSSLQYSKGLKMV